MSRSKKLGALVCLLAVICIVTFAVSKYQQKKEDIKTSGETVFSVSPDDVTAFSWDGDTSLSFHKTDGVWYYDGDENFPVDSEKIETMLERYENFGAAFTIENPDDLSQYGLDNPECTVTITTESGEYTILIGGYSTMDSERYVSTGDGNVYLARSDPLGDYDKEIRDMILDDDLPSLTEADEIIFTGSENYTVKYDAAGDENSIDDDDVYFADGKPLDTARVKTYLISLTGLSLSNYATYNATESDLAEYGLDNPVLTVNVRYTDDGKTDEFTVSVGRNADEVSSAENSGDGDTSDVQAYVRIDDSKIIYLISDETYTKLLACGYDSLRHDEIVTADMDKLIRIDITLDGETYTFSKGDSDENDEWTFGDDTIDISDVKDAITDLSASSFTGETPSGRQEITFTMHFDDDSYPEMTVILYRYNGTNCIAEADGETIGYIPREQAVNLTETINAIILK